MDIDTDYNSALRDRIVQNAINNAYLRQGQQKQQKNDFSEFEKPKPPIPNKDAELIKIRAYSLSDQRYFKNGDELYHNSVILWELWAWRYPLWQENFLWGKTILDQNSIPSIEPDGTIRAVFNPQWYHNTGFKYTTLFVKLISRKYYDVSAEEVSMWLEESKQEDDGEYVVIENPLPGVSIISEVANALNESQIVHALKPVDKDIIDFEKEGADSFIVEYTRPEHPCQFCDCSICYAEVQKIYSDGRPTIMIEGQRYRDLWDDNAVYRELDDLMQAKKANDLLLMDGFSNTELLSAAILGQVTNKTTDQELEQIVDSMLKLIDELTDSISKSDEDVLREAAEIVIKQIMKRLKEKEKENKENNKEEE